LDFPVWWWQAPTNKKSFCFFFQKEAFLCFFEKKNKETFIRFGPCHAGK